MNLLGFTYYFSVCLVLAVFAIYARTQNPRNYPWTKPLPVIWMLTWSIIWLWKMPDSHSLSIYFIWAGLLLGLAGDIFLLKKEWFVPGYLGFAFGHLAYIIGFFIAAPLTFTVLEFTALLIPGIVYALYLSKNTDKKNMIPFIWVYALVISLMFIGALNIGLSQASGWIITSGALFFCISDGFWSRNRFVKELPWPGIMILGTYYAGQALITVGLFFI